MENYDDWASRTQQLLMNSKITEDDLLFVLCDHALVFREDAIDWLKRATEKKARELINTVGNYPNNPSPNDCGCEMLGSNDPRIGLKPDRAQRIPLRST
jgi:hypothetical protein